MKFGVTGVNAGRRVEGPNATILARLAEDAGFESLWTVEHVVVPANYKSQYPYSDTGRMPGKEEVSIGDPLIWL
ncbi:MAG: LLM class flavin-dependent oxidoreductase, partial [Actinomycetota bacterium]